MKTVKHKTEIRNSEDPALNFYQVEFLIYDLCLPVQSCLIDSDSTLKVTEISDLSEINQDQHLTKI